MSVQIEKGGTIPEIILERAKYWADQGRSVCLEDGINGEKKYFKDLESETSRVSSHFYKQGLRKGDIVIHMTSYGVQQAVLTLGLWRANGVLRAIYHDDSEETILEKLVESNSRWILCDAEHISKCKNIVGKVSWPVRLVICGPAGLQGGFDHFDDFSNDDGTECPPLEITQDDMAAILPSSGTTGASKGVQYSHKSLRKIVYLTDVLPHTYPKPNLVASKAVHGTGFIFPMCFIYEGLHTILLHRYDREIILETVGKYEPGYVFAFATLLLPLTAPEGQAKYKKAISGIEHVSMTGAPITKSVHESLWSLPSVKSVTSIYGLTESFPVSHTLDINAPWNSVGKLYPDTYAQIRDLEDPEKVLGNFEKGEICIRAQCMFDGYYKNPEATKKSFTEDGWFRTGDIGHFDENGYLHIVDRAKEIFKVAGRHVSPTELEQVIAQHPAVHQVCVYPIPAETHEIPRAIVTLRNPTKDKPSLAKLAEDIKNFADDKLADFKKIRGGLYIVEELPKGKTGKVVRTMVAQMPLPQH